MKESEFKPLIDRSQSILNSTHFYSQQIETLEDMVNYGTWLIPRARDSSGNTLTDDIVIGSLYKHIISMIDSSEILISNGTTLSTWLQARSAFEALIYIEWILKDNSDIKAKHYYIADLLKRKRFNSRFLEGTTEYDSLKQTLESSKFNENILPLNDEMKEVATKELEFIEDRLNSDLFKDITSSFNKFYKNSYQEIQWFKPLGITSLRQMTKEVNRLVEYEFFYDLSSSIMHARNYQNHLDFLSFKVRYKPIRSLESMDNLIQWLYSTFLYSTLNIILLYRNGEQKQFLEKYYRDWRTSLFNITHIDYTHNDQES